MYKIFCDNYFVGVLELTKEDIKLLLCDPDIRVIKIA